MRREVDTVKALRSIVSGYGLALAGDPDRLTALLADHAGSSPETRALIAAAADGVPSRLNSADAEAELERVEAGGVTVEDAWATQAWAAVLGKLPSPPPATIAEYQATLSKAPAGGSQKNQNQPGPVKQHSPGHGQGASGPVRPPVSTPHVPGYAYAAVAVTALALFIVAANAPGSDLADHLIRAASTAVAGGVWAWVVISWPAVSDLDLVFAWTVVPVAYAGAYLGAGGAGLTDWFVALLGGIGALVVIWASLGGGLTPKGARVLATIGGAGVVLAFFFRFGVEPDGEGIIFAALAVLETAVLHWADALWALVVVGYALAAAPE